MIRHLTRTQVAMCLVPLLVAVGLFGVARAFPGTPADEVCGNAFQVLQVGLGDQTQSASGSGITPEQSAQALGKIDFDVLARGVPARLREDVEVLRKGAPELQASILGPPDEVSAKVDPRLLAAAAAVFTWVFERCQ